MSYRAFLAADPDLCIPFSLHVFLLPEQREVTHRFRSTSCRLSRSA